MRASAPGVIRLLIADDHPVVREGLKSVIAPHPDVECIGEAEDGDQALAECARLRPDVILLDVSMPGPGVLELIRRLRLTVPEVRLLVLSIHPEQHYARRVLKAGADGYINKNHTADGLYSAIRQVYRGRKYITPNLAEQLACEVAGEREGQLHDRLSNREYEVFVQLGSGCTVIEVARRLGVKPKTVRTYQARIREKTNLKTNAEIIYYTITNGLIVSLDADETGQPAEPPLASAPSKPAADPRRIASRANLFSPAPPRARR